MEVPMAAAPVLPSPASSGRLRVNLGAGAAAAGGFGRSMLSPAAGGGDDLNPGVAAASAAAAKAAAAAACSAAAASSAAGPRRDGPQVAPRDAKEKLRRAREAFKLTASQFAGLLSTPSQAVNQQLLTHWEMGFRRVPQPVLLKVEQMHAQLLKEQQKQKEAEVEENGPNPNPSPSPSPTPSPNPNPPIPNPNQVEENGGVVMVNPEYPYQEPMIS
jgi:DNA-binding transcriptional regulator YiaG